MKLCLVKQVADAECDGQAPAGLPLRIRQFGLSLSRRQTRKAGALVTANALGRNVGMSLTETTSIDPGRIAGRLNVILP